MAGFQLQLFLSPLTLGEKGSIFRRKSSFKLSHLLAFKVLVSNIQGTGYTEVSHSQRCKRTRKETRNSEEVTPDRMRLGTPRLLQTRQETGQYGTALGSRHSETAAKQLSYPKPTPAVSGPCQLNPSLDWLSQGSF